jgi:RimJ/RimL family protein N-acetyltransferase
MDSIQIRLRLARPEDGPDIWRWRNDPLSRQYSFNSAPIPLEPHLVWWAASLANLKRRTYILENELGEGLGSLRKDELETGEIELSWMIAPEHRGKGYGTILLRLGLAGETARCIALIKPENIASCRMVEKLGFSKREEGVYEWIGA